jgi:hypothetical protein
MSKDIALGNTATCAFTTRAFPTGIPTTLAGSPVLSVVEHGNNTPITTGVSVAVDRCSVPGLNEATAIATTGNGYEAGKTYCWYISTGTVGGISVVGEVVGEFTIEATSGLRPTVAGRTVDVTATGAAGIDWSNVENPTTTVGLTGTTMASTQKVDVDTMKGNPVINGGTVTFPTNATLASTTNITAGTMTTSTNVTTVNGLAANVLTAAATAADFVAEIAGGGLDAAGIRAALGMASANLDTQLADLPTNAELATALAAADDAVLAAIAALNNLSQANIRTAIGLASANLDTQLDALPTTTELTTALGTADDAMLAAIAALNNLSAAGVRAAVGLASANLDTQLADLPTTTELTAAFGTADDAVLAAIAALNNLSAAEANAEIVDALAVDTYAEPAQGAPGATIPLAAKINYIYKFLRNQVQSDLAGIRIYADDGSTVDHKSPHSDDGTTYTRGKFITGP